eukprot:Blabericola_migrator_1__10578@NODE_5_length_29060_cov_171_088642_g4_i0_p13_GENE_NODE_5_length_29060_cov_171_088642_g4_i0NODE_5_length_29060_cov_171_088642_g4_i0_p13_ORF_typecomplete_len274_score19_03Acetyltransf_10/PF13673_7/0_48IGPS/PF00218_21/81IGPS/PF00218_21/3_8_NODE_5_length_29060_cov_171_088642_g4_i058976718
MKNLIFPLLAVQCALAAGAKYSRCQINDRTSAALEKSLVDFSSHFQALRHVKSDGIHVIETNISSPYYNLMFSTLSPIPVDDVSRWTAYWRLARKQATWITMPGNDVSPELAGAGWVQYPSRVGMYYNLSVIHDIPFVVPEVSVEQDSEEVLYRISRAYYGMTTDDLVVTNLLKAEIHEMTMWEKLDLGYWYAQVDGEIVASARLTYDGTFALISDLIGVGDNYDEALLKGLLLVAKRDGMEYAVMIQNLREVARYMKHGFHVSGVWETWRLI